VKELLDKISGQPQGAERYDALFCCGAFHWVWSAALNFAFQQVVDEVKVANLHYLHVRLFA